MSDSDHVHHRRRASRRPSRARRSWRPPTRRASTSRGSATMKGLTPLGSCRVCTVLVNGRPQAACTQPVAAGHGRRERRPSSCRTIRTRPRSRCCSSRATTSACSARRAATASCRPGLPASGITAPQVPLPCSPQRDVDATHPDIFIDRNRCILCAPLRPRLPGPGRQERLRVRRPRAAQAHRGQRRGAAGGHRTSTSTDKAVGRLPGRRHRRRSASATRCPSGSACTTTSPSAPTSRRASEPK